MKLIDKDVLIEKLWERRIKHRDFGGSPHSEYGHEDDEILSLINSLEVKEVDLEKKLYDIKRACGIFKENDIGEISGNCLNWVAKHFYELGLKAQKEND